VRAEQLVGRLTELFGAGSVAFDSSRNEVTVSAEWESRDAGPVIEAIESWTVAGAEEVPSIGGRRRDPRDPEDLAEAV
jgi:hypothetical protein